ncbi:MAG TPA: hypothetical protein VGS07_09535 [Thermoanaerobaculia bacterium]|jgi:hypothetical protein|nr:hypothetical protein [Thermoanaerobaculia bacterium]
MAQDNRPEVSAAPRGAEQISLEQLVSSTSSAVLRIIKEHENPQSGFVFNPRIWCGIWFDLDRFGPRGPLGPGGGGPIAGGG